MEEEATNPVEVEEQSETETEVEETEEIVGEDESEEGETGEEDDLEEVELDGQKIRVSKGAKEYLLRQADYTRKTQEVAEQRRQLEERLSAFSQTSEAENAARGRKLMLEQQIEQAKQIDWAAWFNTNPSQAQAARIEFETLKDQLADADKQLSEATQQRQLQEQQETAERLEKGRAELASKIEGWGPDKARAIADGARTEFGFTEQEIASETDPRVIIMLNDALEHRKSLAKTRGAERARQQAQIKPAARVRGEAPASQTLSQLAKRGDVDGWLKVRNAQLKRKGKA